MINLTFLGRDDKVFSHDHLGRSFRLLGTTPTDLSLATSGTNHWLIVYLPVGYIDRAKDLIAIKVPTGKVLPNLHEDFTESLPLVYKCQIYSNTTLYVTIAPILQLTETGMSLSRSFTNE